MGDERYLSDKPADEQSTVKKRKSGLWETIQIMLIAVILALLVRTFIVERFVVVGYSMEPTLVNGENLLVNKLAYRFGQPQDGQIIVFHPPLPVNQDFIKRVIATPGQTVSMRNGVVYVNNKKVPEPYIKYLGNASFPPVTVTANHVFVLGDNRPHSEDSRYFGLVPDSSIKGEAVFSFWPLDKFGPVT